MTSRFSVRGLFARTALVCMWCALWGEVTVANVLSGAVLVLVVPASGLGASKRGGVRPLPLLRFGWLVLVDLVHSTIAVAREVITPADRTDEAIIAVSTPRGSRAHLLLLIVAVTVTPGTAVVDADPDTGTLYLHLLHGSHIDKTTAHVQQLAALACAALPIPEPRPCAGLEADSSGATT